MASAHPEENQGVVTEESSTLLSADILADDKSGEPPRAILECHICMEVPTDPVAASCGHVFCWPCLRQWLQNSVKPCPICRQLVSRNVNVLSIHQNAEDAAARARKSHGKDSAGEAAGAGNVGPPRPANPLLFVPRKSGASPESEVSECRAIMRAVSALARERSRARSLELERACLEERKADLLRRTSDATQESKRMGEHLAQLKRRLALATQQLASQQVSSGTGDSA